jgi:hypothetical protein
VEEEDAVTQEPAPLNILAAAATSHDIEIIKLMGEELGVEDAMEIYKESRETPQCPHDIKITKQMGKELGVEDAMEIYKESRETPQCPHDIEITKQVGEELEMKNALELIKEYGETPECSHDTEITEPKDDTLEDSEEFYAVTPERSQDTIILEEETERRDSDILEQDAVTQEPATLNIIVQPAKQTGEKSEIEYTLEFNDELWVVTPEEPHCTELTEEELQQKKDEEGIQEVATQEPTPLEAAARTPELQAEDNLGVNTQQGGDEQVQTPYSGDTEILEEELQFEEDIQSVTQEPVSPEATEVAVEESLKDVAVTQEPATTQPQQ